MKLLAIDTSTERASVALGVPEIYSDTLNSQKTQAQWLLPTIAQLLALGNVTIKALDAIVFGRGPGSFTGLRVACSIAKGLAYPHGIELIPVSSLAAIAFEVRKLPAFSNMAVLAMLDARMQEVYWGFFPPFSLEAEDKLSPIIDVRVDTPVILAGVDYARYTQAFSPQLQKQIVQSLTVYPTAAAMIGLAQTETIKPISVYDAKPLYIRSAITSGERHG